MSPFAVDFRFQSLNAASHAILISRTVDLLGVGLPPRSSGDEAESRAYRSADAGGGEKRSDTEPEQGAAGPATQRLTSRAGPLRVVSRKLIARDCRRLAGLSV
jgi:hypothetical protein